MRQQQRPDNTHEPDISFSVRAEAAFPSTPSSPTSHVRQDIGRHELRQGQIASDLVILSQLLTGSQPAEQRVAAALVVATRLLPAEWRLRLFECWDSGTLIREITPSNDYPVSGRQELHRILGFDEAIDDRVLHERARVRTERLVCMPLIDSTGSLVGVLVAQSRSETPGSSAVVDDALLEVIGAHLTTLLAYATEERFSHASTKAMQSLSDLALPLVTQFLARESGPWRDVAVLKAFCDAQSRLLTSVVVALNEVIMAAGYAESAVALALAPTRTPSGDWKLLCAGCDLEQVAPVFSDEMMSSIMRLASQHTHDAIEPFEVELANSPVAWDVLAPLRARIAEYEAIEVAHLTLFPIIDTQQQLTAWLCIAGDASAKEGLRRLLLPAASIASATTAEARNLQLAMEVREEGRARDAFISLTAHELRSPLTSIKGYAQLLMRQSKKHPIPDSMLHSVESIEQQSGRMAEMVGELLDASRITRGVLEVQVSPVDLVPLARKVVERRAAQFPQHTITFDTVEKSVVALTDAQRVEQVLRDLIDNGARHMPRGGTVTVTLSRQDGMALVAVRDQGIGIPKGERERIFEYLYRSSLSEQKNLSGLGLGLYISRHLVERFGGRLWLEFSRVAEPSGSEFRFTLPLTQPLMDKMRHQQQA